MMQQFVLHQLMKLFGFGTYLINGALVKMMGLIAVQVQCLPPLGERVQNRQQSYYLPHQQV